MTDTSAAADFEYAKSSRETNFDLHRILDAYGPQLGELIWHSVHFDDSLLAVSEKHAQRIVDVVEQFQLRPKGRPLRILEVGAYAHFDVALACSLVEGDALGWTHDISPRSLRVGLSEAAARGLPAVTAVAGDFHRLPFADGFFDVVFCASCVHHTYRPWLMLSEMLRVVRAGGIVRIDNEPVARKFCFYQFRSNRPDSRTEFEQTIENAGLTWTIISPFPGSRPEALFGMIENDRIPLSVYMNTFDSQGAVEALDLIPQIATFENDILALPLGLTLERGIHEVLLGRCDLLRKQIRPVDGMLGFTLPDTDRLWQMSYETAERIRNLAKSSGEKHTADLADLFGATLRATVRKAETARCASNVPYLVDLPMQDGVLLDLPELPDVRLDFESTQLPAIETGIADIVKLTYSPPDWIYYEEANGLRSVLNSGALGRIPLPESSHAGLMLIRFYAVARSENAPYVVRFLNAGGEELSRHEICQTESCLARFLTTADDNAVYLRLEDMDGALAEDVHVRVRIGAARRIPIKSIKV